MSDLPRELLRFVLETPGAGQAMRSAGDQWMMRCPAHRDNVSSLAVRLQEGRILLYCHAGCATESILRAWGIDWSALYPNGDIPGREIRVSQSSRDSQANQPSQGSQQSPKDQEKPQSQPPRGREVCAYEYRDEGGTVLYQTVRFDDPKDFAQRRPLIGGGWAWNLRHTRRVLYRLPELLAADANEHVYVCEGEKDADAIAREGRVATTAPLGAGKWRPEYSEPLRGRKVVLLPDNDDPGRAHMKRVATALEGIAAEVRVLTLDGLPEHGDVSDWLAAGHSTEELAEKAQKLVFLVPTKGGDDIPRLSHAMPDSWVWVDAPELLGDSAPEPPDLVEGLLPQGGISVFGAKPKVGKSTLVRCLAVAVAQGGEILGRACVQGPVIYLCLEEKRSEVRNHFRELGLRPSDPLLIHFGAAPPKALESLTEVIRQVQPALVVIDPLFRFTRVKDIGAYAELTNALGPIVEVARIHGTHLLLVHHTSKLEREGGDDILGSTAIFGSVDTVVIMRRRQGGLRYCFSVQRYGRDYPETVLELRDGWIVTGGSLNMAEVSQLRSRVLDWLGPNSPAAEIAIRECVEGKGGDIGKALRRLVEEGRIGRSGSGKRGDPYLYALVPLSPDTPAEVHDGNEVCPACGHQERDTMTSEGRPSAWRCRSCGQVYGQTNAFAKDNEDDKDSNTSGDEQSDQNRQPDVGDGVDHGGEGRDTPW